MPAVSPDTALLNFAVFNSWNVIATYDDEELFPPERRLLDELAGWLAGRAVLDLGVGTGRTTPHLLPLCGRYVGVDYSPGMVAACRRKFPGVDLRQADAARLDDFADGTFDLVCFSYNGLDTLNLDQRGRALAEAHRVLAPGGRLMFSSHNLFCPPRPPGRMPDFRWSWSPPRLLRRVLGALRRGWVYRSNYRRLKPLEAEGDGVAVYVDAGHDYRLLNGYITPQRQARDLAGAGFTLERVLDVSGDPVAPGGRPSSAWLQYLARKPD